MDIDALIKGMGEHFGVSDLECNTEGVASIMCNKKHVVNFEKDEGGVLLHMYTIIGEIPDEEREIFLMTLMEANLFGTGTGGARLALDMDTEEVFLCRTFEVKRLDLEYFCEKVESFISYMEAWSTSLDIGDIGKFSNKSLKDKTGDDSIEDRPSIIIDKV